MEKSEIIQGYKDKILSLQKLRSQLLVKGDELHQAMLQSVVSRTISVTEITNLLQEVYDEVEDVELNIKTLGAQLRKLRNKEDE
jgi:hypothetical protein